MSEAAEPIDRKIAVAFESLQRAHAERKEREAKAKTADRPTADPPEEKQLPGQLILFPQWTDARRATAQAIFRSALFPALGRGKRQFFKNQKIYSTRGAAIFFTGEQFDQSDLDVYLEMLHILKDQPSGTKCTFSAYGLLKAIGRSTGNKDHKWLHSVLIRLCGGVVDLTDHKKRYFGSLLDGGIKDEITKHYIVPVNPDFAKMLRATWSSLDHEQRKKLKNNPTAKALHAYYSTHAAPGAHSFGTLADIAGLKNSNRRDLKARITKAHELLKTDDIGFLKDYEIEGDTIKTRIQHTTGQNRHIARKVIEGRKKQRGQDTA